MTTEPACRILLDVDGVINVLGLSQDWPEYKIGWANGFQIQWAPECIDQLCELAALPHVDMRWLTTWCERANQHISPLTGMRQLPVLARLACEGWWKLRLAQELWENGHTPFVWIDDDIRYVPEAMAWIHTLPSRHAMAVCPDYEHGLIPSHLDMIRQFVEQHQQGMLVREPE